MMRMGNTTDKTFDVVVKKKVEKKATTEQNSETTTSQNNSTGQQTQAVSPSSPAQSNQSSGSSGQSGTTSGGSSSGNSGTSKPAEQQKPTTCYVPNNQLGESGQIFKTEAEAYKYGADMEGNPKIILCHTVLDQLLIPVIISLVILLVSFMVIKKAGFLSFLFGIIERKM